MTNILICDDETDIVTALKIYLKAEGYSTYTAHNGRDALKCLAEKEIHLILLDIMMPEMDGIRRRCWRHSWINQEHIRKKVKI